MMEQAKFELKGQRVLVVGMGLSGLAAAEFLFNHGAYVCGIDQNAHLLDNDLKIKELKSKGVQFLVEGALKDISPYQLIVVSPGIPKNHFIYEHASKKNIEIIGEIELACRFFTKQPLIGITGTNGKTTVTLLVTHILNQSGFKALALGNVGVPLSSQLLSQDEKTIGVIELSSFQLETLYKPVFQLGVILNITPDHLDRYVNMQQYSEAKIHLKNCLKPNGKLYVQEKCYEQNKELFGSFKPFLYGYSAENFLSYDEKHFFWNQQLSWSLPASYQYKKSHDIENIMAAYGICRELGLSNEQFERALSSFKKPPHRIEFVDKIHGISYFDDSKGTNIDAVIRAVESLPGKIVLIAGGVDKGASYKPWIKKFKSKVKCICAIGEAAEKMKKELGSDFPVHILSTLDEAVKFASKEALAEENVLLSPGCSSFDMFKNYVHRGEEFKRSVDLLHHF